MQHQINIHEAKSQLSRLIELTRAGEEVVIAKAGKPIAKLVPLGRDKPSRKLGLLDGKISVPDDFNKLLLEEVLAQFEGGD